MYLLYQLLWLWHTRLYKNLKLNTMHTRTSIHPLSVNAYHRSSGSRWGNILSWFQDYIILLYYYYIQDLNNESSDIVYLSYCQQTSQKNQDQHCMYLRATIVSSVPQSSIVVRRQRAVAPGNVFIHLHKHTHCSSVWFNHTPSCCHKYSLRHQMLNNPHFKIVKVNINSKYC